MPLTPFTIKRNVSVGGPSPIQNFKPINDWERGLNSPKERLTRKWGEGLLRYLKVGTLLFTFLFPLLTLYSPADALDFRYRFDSYQHFGQPGYLAKVFNRNQEFAFATQRKSGLYLEASYHFNALVDGPVAIHQWSPITGTIGLSPETQIQVGMAAPYDTTLGTPSQLWVNQTVLSDAGWSIDWRTGFRFDGSSWLLQPVLHWRLLPYLSIGVNDGTMVEYLLNQEPLAQMVIATPGVPLQSAFQWEQGQLCWKAILTDTWQLF